MVQRVKKVMSTELQTVEPDGKLLRSAFCEQAFTELSAQVAELDATTPEGYEKTKNAIRWCVKARSAVSKLKEDLNREALRHQRAVNADEKYLIDLIRTVEDPLAKKKKAVDDEVERKRAELEAKHQAWINARIAESVEATGKPITTEEAETWTDEQFAEHIEAGRKAKAEADAKAKAEAARLAQEEADRKAKIQAEQDQIAADRAELARQKAEQDAEAKRIKDEQDQRDRDIEAKLAKIQEAEEKAARIQPATVIGENDLAGKLLRSHEDRSGAEQVLKAQVEAMANFPEFPCPGFPETEDLKGESRDALVLVSSEVDDDDDDEDDDEEARKLIAPNRSEIMLLLGSMQANATRLEAFFDDAEGVLLERYVMAEDIRIAVDDLLEEMDKLAPK
jgi:hypothetical protein